MLKLRSLRRRWAAALMACPARATPQRPRPPRAKMSLEFLEDRCLLSFVEFPVPTPSSGLTVLTSGPDGNLWFDEFTANQIGKISTDGVVTEYAIPTPNSQPVGLAAGPDGNLWFPEFNGNKIGRITPDGVVTEFPGPTPNSHLQQITAGADGNLWFIDKDGGPGHKGAIGRITPDGDITEFPVLPQLNGGTHRIAAGPDGNVWFSEPAALGRVTPAGDITVFPLPSSASIPSGIVAGPDGNVWFTDAGINAVSRMDPTTGEVTAEFPVPSGNIPFDITVGPNGNLWFAEQSQHALVNNGIGEVTTDGTFTEFTDPNPGALPVGLDTGADGNVFFTDQVRNTIVRFLDDGLPRPPFQPVATYATDVSPFTVHTADLRGNGILDLITGNESHLVGQTLVPGSVSVLLGNGDGSFQSHVDYAAGFSPRAVAIGDFTGDGIPDLVVADEGSPGSEDGGLRILRGNGDGTFQLAQNILLGRSVFDVVAGDFSHTGHLDLVISTNAGVQELRGNGDGTFQAPVSISALSGRLTVGDFNHDGSLDLALASPTTVQVFLGNGDGTFALAQQFSTGSQFGPVDVLAADLGVNGTLDLVLSGGFLVGPRVALGNGDGTFQAPVAVPGADGLTNGVAVAALNGNGIPDLIVGLSQSVGVQVLLGNGDGTFRFGGDFVTGANPFAVAVGDLNGDGLPDIVVANSFGGNVGVLIKTGAGFGPGAAPGAHQPGAGGRAADGSPLTLPTDAHPLAVAARSVPAAESSQAAVPVAVDSLFATHHGEFAGFDLTAAHHKALAGRSGDWLDLFTNDPWSSGSTLN
jgi:streptogramin lyase